MDDKEKTCSICSVKFTGWGNNPAPFDSENGERCCDCCNDRFVVPARLYKIYDPGILRLLAQIANAGL